VLRRMRALVDEYDDRALIGEVGDNDRAIELMGEYTSGSDKLHMAYSFDMLSPEYSPQHFRGVIDRFWTGAPDGWPCWSFSNHDVIRHATRWEKHDAGDDAIAIQAIALLMSLRGTICLYQGEELGQLETVLTYDELTDPVGLTNWPANKGRDGCRTPMTWDSAAPNAGFSTVKPWLPVKPLQAARSVSAQEACPDSTLAYYRQAIAWRKSQPALRSGKMRFRRGAKGILRFTRGEGAEALDCVFNLSPKGVRLAMPDHATLVGPHRGALVSGDKLRLGQNGFCWLGPRR
jgi:alpha-glucosidase